MRWSVLAGPLLGLFVQVGCSSSLPLISGPPTLSSISNAVKNSSMNSGHFTVRGNIAAGANRYATTGEGTMQVKPFYALQVNLQVSTGTLLGTIGYDEIVVNNYAYSRTGIAAWTYQSDNSEPSSLTPDKYIGEETLNGSKSWHTQQHAGSTTYEDWVRESDGYLVKHAYSLEAAATLVWIFDSYNTGTSIMAPEFATPASPTPGS
jgi:hypothetical protein